MGSLDEDRTLELLLVTELGGVESKLVETTADARDAVLSVDGDLHDVHVARVGQLTLTGSVLVHDPRVCHAAVVGDEEDLIGELRRGDGRPRPALAPRLGREQSRLVVAVAPAPQPRLLAALVPFGGGGLAKRIKDVAAVLVLGAARRPREGEHGHLARVGVHLRELRETRRGEERGDDENLPLSRPPLQPNRRAAVAHALSHPTRDGQGEHLVPVDGLGEERD